MSPSIVIHLTCDIIPKKNALRAGISKRGRLFQYKSKSARASQNVIAWQAAEQARAVDWDVTEKPVKVSALLRKRRGDCIGALETILDALEHVIYKNDRQVHWLDARWDTGKALPKGETAEIEIKIL